MSDLDYLTLAMYRTRLLKGDALPGGQKMLRLSKEEHELNEKVAAKHKIEGTPAYGELIGGIHPDFVTYKGRSHAVYLGRPPKDAKRPIGRPRSLLTKEERVRERAQLIEKWEREGWSRELLRGLKREHLFAVASHAGVNDPGHQGSNARLINLISKRLGI